MVILRFWDEMVMRIENRYKEKGGEMDSAVVASCVDGCDLVREYLPGPCSVFIEECGKPFRATACYVRTCHSSSTQ